MTGETIMANGQISAVEVAVLAERVDRVLNNYEELRGLILAQNAQLSQVPLIAQSLSETRAAIDRAFSTLRNHGDRLNVLERSDYNNRFILRLTGALLMASVGVIGWGGTLVSQFYKNDDALDRRTLLIEYKLGIQTPHVDGSK